MVSLVLLAQNDREEQILKMALEQQGIKVLLSKPSYNNYITIVQFSPDLILLDIPHVAKIQTEFSTRIRKYKRTQSIPIIGYGGKIPDMLKRGLLENGVTVYIERPLKFNNLLNLFGRLLKSVNKKIEPKTTVIDKDSDMELIMNPDTPTNKKIEVMTHHVSALLAFPFIIAKVLQITQDDKSGAGDLAQAVEADPAMSTHLLKVANSVFFASSNRRINSIQDSIVRIGFMETKKIIMSMSIMKLFDSKNKNLGFDRIDFWYHSLAVGLITERIAKIMGGVNLEEAFLAGLLHDLGIIILDDFFPSIFSSILESNSNESGLFPETMQKILKITHNDLIAELFPTWKIPQNITDAITLQEKIEQFEGSIDTDGKKMALCVAIANIVAKSMHIGKECDEFIKPLNNWILKSVKLPYGIQSNFIEHIIQNVEIFRNFLGLEKREYLLHADFDIGDNMKIAIANLAGASLIPPALYFLTEKIPYEQINLKEDLSCYDNKFDLIIAIVSEIVAPEKINTLGKIARAQHSIESPAQDEIFTPVIIIGPSDFRTEQLNNDFIFIQNRFDLRTFDLKLEDLLNMGSEQPNSTKKDI